MNFLAFIPESYSQPFECFKSIECEGYSESGQCITTSEKVATKEDTAFTNIQNKWWTKSEQIKIARRVHSSFLSKNKNGSTCILLIESRDRKCISHICQANIGIVIFEITAGNLEVIYDQKDITALGNFGKAPDAHLEEIGKDNIGIAFIDEIMHQGFIFKSYVLISKVNNTYKEILNVDTAEDGRSHMTNRSNYHWDSEIEFIKGDNNRFYDVRIKKQGTKRIDKNDEHEIIPFTEEKIYKFINNKHVLIKK